MKIKGKNFEVLTEYPLFKIGTDTDCDLLSRMCGIEDGESVAVAEISVERNGKKFDVIFTLKSVGEQKRITLIQPVSNTILGYSKEVLEKANNRELKEERDILFMLEQMKKDNLNYGNNCWYEADIEVKNEDKESIFSDCESNMGLDGVRESIIQFKEMIDNDTNLLENLEFIFEEIENQ